VGHEWASRASALGVTEASGVCSSGGFFVKATGWPRVLGKTNAPLDLRAIVLAGWYAWSVIIRETRYSSCVAVWHYLLIIKFGQGGAGKGLRISARKLLFPTDLKSQVAVVGITG